jgi:hypothetical protein
MDIDKTFRDVPKDEKKKRISPCVQLTYLVFTKHNVGSRNEIKRPMSTTRCQPAASTHPSVLPRTSTVQTMALGCKNELVPAFPLVAPNERNAPAADPMLGVRTEALNEFAAPKPTVACGRSPMPVEELPQAVESPPGPALAIGELVGRAE